MKNIIFTVLKIFIILIFVAFILEEYFVIKEYKNDEKLICENKNVDYVIILGARVYGEKPSQSLVERIKKASEFLHKNKLVKVIASGGKGVNEKISEALAIKRELLKLGISEERIILEDKSRNTIQNFEFSLKKIKEDNPQKNKKNILIVTNNYHIFRAKNIAKSLGYEKEGYKFYGLPAKTPLIFIPKSHFREFLSNIKFFILDKKKN